MTLSTPSSAPPALDAPLLEVTDLVREYTLPREHLLRPPAKVQALKGVSFSMPSGRSLGIVGESGSGKSTLARTVMALDAPTSGSVRLLGRDLHQLPAAALREARHYLQIKRPDLANDLSALRRVAGWLSRIRLVNRRADAPALMDEFAATCLEEIDYLNEAANAERFAENFADNPRVRVPGVVWERSTRRVLVQEDVTNINSLLQK